MRLPNLTRFRTPAEKMRLLRPVRILGMRTLSSVRSGSYTKLLLARWGGIAPFWDSGLHRAGRGVPAQPFARAIPEVHPVAVSQRLGQWFLAPLLALPVGLSPCGLAVCQLCCAGHQSAIDGRVAQYRFHVGARGWDGNCLYEFRRLAE